MNTAKHYGITSTAALLGAGLIFASVVQAGEVRQSGRAVVKATNSGALCRSGYFSSTDPVIPPDDRVEDNPSAAAITISKNCAGAVIAQFSAETSGVIHVVGRATCVATGGFSSPCTVGSTVLSSFGTNHYYLDDEPTGAVEGHSVILSFKGLARGKWKIEVLPGIGGSTGALGFRTMVVNAYVGG